MLTRTDRIGATMATLTVDATKDFTGTTLTNIDSIVFGDASTNIKGTFSSKMYLR